MDENNNETSLFDTKVEDMTVGDAMKINGIVLGAMAGLGFAAAGLAVLPEKIRAYRYNRNMKKLAKIAAEEKPEEA